MKYLAIVIALLLTSCSTQHDDWGALSQEVGKTITKGK